MEPMEYLNMSLAEESIFWYRSLHSLILHFLGDYVPDLESPILDAGCGTGGLLSRLHFHNRNSLYGVDYTVHALRIAKEKCRANLVYSSVDKLPFPDRFFQAITSIDVLYHCNVNEKRAIKESYRCLRPGGFFILNLPAYSWLYSQHDRAVQGVRRYTKKRASAMLESAGFVVVRATYWNSILFLPLAIKRKLFPGKVSDVKIYPQIVDYIFSMLMDIERYLIAKKLDIFFGSSILLVARRVEK